MSASEWARIVDERDAAICYVEKLLYVVDNYGGDSTKEAIEARNWFDEYNGEDDE